MKDIEMPKNATKPAPIRRDDKRLFSVAPEHPFLAWHFRRSTAITIMNFLVGFFVAWIMCMAAFKYVFATLFAV